MQITLIIATVLIVLYILSKQKNQASVTLGEIKEALQQGGILLDVRTSSEFRTGHAAGAKNMPLQQLQNNQFPKYSKDKPVFVYCHSGARASAAKRLLQKAGFENVVNIGGLGKWRKMGGTIVK